MTVTAKSGAAALPYNNGMQAAEKIAVVGLGYVGLPLALALARYYNVVGVDNDATRIAELRAGVDRTGETGSEQITTAGHSLQYAESLSAAADCSVFIVTVPTPVGADERPDLSLLEQATREVGGALKKGDLVVFESTVCPGTTDNFCIPILQDESGLRVCDDFDCAYSPERIAPNEKGLSDAVKIVSAANEAALRRVSRLYQNIIPQGLHAAPDIKTAEAAKLTENIQRDIDIAVINELAMIYGRMGIDSDAVFAAAATKWNFRRFFPGLVGGHCIGTDTYYLLDRTDREGYPADLLRVARRVNNAVPDFVAENVLRLIAERGLSPAQTKAVIFGFSFKENCPDVRSTLVYSLFRSLSQAGCQVRVCDPVADREKTQAEYGIELVTDISVALADKPDVAVFAVAHRQFRDIPAAALDGVLVADVKRIAARADWRL